MSETTRKKAIVTGGAAGLGRATALRLAMDGYAVAVLDADTAAGHRTAGRVADLSEGHFLPCDVTEPARVHQAVDQAVALLGGLDLLVCAAHQECEKPVEQVTEADWDRVVGTDLVGALMTAQAALRHLRAAGGGCIVLLSSVHARIGSGVHAAYSSAMAGLAAAGRSLAAELAPDRIRVCTVSPYTVVTESTEVRLADPRWRELQESTVLDARVPAAAEVADVIAFVASEQGEVFNASDLVVDGGMSQFRERPAVSAYQVEEGAR